MKSRRPAKPPEAQTGTRVVSSIGSAPSQFMRPWAACHPARSSISGPSGSRPLLRVLQLRRCAGRSARRDHRLGRVTTRGDVAAANPASWSWTSHPKTSRAGSFWPDTEFGTGVGPARRGDRRSGPGRAAVSAAGARSCGPAGAGCGPARDADVASGRACCRRPGRGGGPSGHVVAFSCSCGWSASSWTTPQPEAFTRSRHQILVVRSCRRTTLDQPP